MVVMGRVLLVLVVLVVVVVMVVLEIRRLLLLLLLLVEWCYYFVAEAKVGGEAGREAKGGRGDLVVVVVNVLGAVEVRVVDKVEGRMMLKGVQHRRTKAKAWHEDACRGVVCLQGYRKARLW